MKNEWRLTMILKSDRIAELLENKAGADDRLLITPQPDVDVLRRDGAASIDLRLGTWFVSLRQSRSPMLALSREESLSQESTDSDTQHHGRITRSQYVPFGNSYILHPGQFVLGATMEWIRLPSKLAGYVV